MEVLFDMLMLTVLCIAASVSFIFFETEESFVFKVTYLTSTFFSTILAIGVVLK